MAEPASVSWIVWVESELCQFASAVWVVVGYGCYGCVAGDAYWVAVQDLSAELLVSA